VRIRSILRPSARSIVSAFALVLVLGVVACGDSEDEPQSGGQQADSSQAQPRTDGESGSPAAGDDQDGGDDGQAGAGSDVEDGVTLSGDREQARQGADAVDRVYDDIGAAVESGVAAADVPIRDTLDAADGNDGLTSLCELLSTEAQRQTIVYAKRSAGLAEVDWSCEKAMALLLRRSRQAGALERTLDAEVIGVNVKGDRATATIRFGDGAKSKASTVSLVKEDGEWKLAASPGRG
jgi:hypothetical protein